MREYPLTEVWGWKYWQKLVSFGSNFRKFHSPEKLKLVKDKYVRARRERYTVRELLFLHQYYSMQTGIRVLSSIVIPIHAITRQPRTDMYKNSFERWNYWRLCLLIYHFIIQWLSGTTHMQLAYHNLRTAAPSHCRVSAKSIVRSFRYQNFQNICEPHSFLLGRLASKSMSSIPL